MHRFLSNYAASNEWATQEISKWLLSIDDEILKKHVPSSFTSINYTLQHILRTQRFWMLFTEQKSFSGFSWSVRDESTTVILRELNESSAYVRQVVDSWTEQDLQEQLKLDMPWAKNQLPRYEYIVHLINHSTFHRGQVVTMARVLGITDGIPATDYNIFNCQPE